MPGTFQLLALDETTPDAVARAVLRLWRRLVGAGLLAFTAGGAHAFAQPATSGAPAAPGNETIAVEVTASILGSECPTAELVETQLRPLVGNDHGSARATIEDRGDEYVVAVAGAQREVRDPSRNCLERARVAAVFIALNLPPTPLPAKQPEPQPEPVPPPESVASHPRSRISPEIRTQGAVAAAPPHIVPGVTAGVGGATEKLRLALDFGFLVPATLEREALSATLRRYPTVLAVGPRWRARGWELWPHSGAVIDLMTFRGRGAATTQSSSRANLGLDLGVEARLAATARLSLLAGVGLAWFPRGYTVRVDPAIDLGKTPNAWLSGKFGLAVALAPKKGLRGRSSRTTTVP